MYHTRQNCLYVFIFFYRDYAFIVVQPLHVCYSEVGTHRWQIMYLKSPQLEDFLMQKFQTHFPHSTSICEQFVNKSCRFVPSTKN